MSTLKGLKPVIVSGKEVLPIIEGGKGIGVSNGISAGAFANTGAVGTFSAVNAEFYDDDGNPLPIVFHGKTRRERHEELVRMSIEGGIAQARNAHEGSGGEGRLHMNVLWEMGGAERILHGILEETKDIVHGITCGAGMPYRLAEISEQYNMHYYPIVSSMRAFRALWKRSYHKKPELLGGVVYEDPWLAGGHNGLSNSEDPEAPEDPYPRVAELRTYMNEVGIKEVPIVMAGGVWHLKDWEDWLDNPEIGPVVFQYGTRPLLTVESPAPEIWKNKLMNIKDGDIYLHRYSPTGFYSSAVRNDFLDELDAREMREVPYATAPEGYLTEPVPVGMRGRHVYVSADDNVRTKQYIDDGFDEPMKTPDSTIIFVTKERSKKILKDQIDCMGCLSHCRFSNWKDHDDNMTGKRTDPRSFCIQKTLQHAIHGKQFDDCLMFSGHNAYKFSEDPFYKDGFIPTVKQLVERIMTGD